MNKFASFSGHNSEVYINVRQWLKENPSVNIISHAHVVQSNFHYITIIYKDESVSL